MNCNTFSVTPSIIDDKVKTDNAIDGSNSGGLKCDQLASAIRAIEQYTFKNVSNCLNTNIYNYLETSGGQSSNLYLELEVVHFFNASVN